MALLKYVIYAVLAIILYLVAGEFYNGNFDNTITLSKIKEQSIMENKSMVDTAKGTVENFAD